MIRSINQSFFTIKIIVITILTITIITTTTTTTTTIAITITIANQRSNVYGREWKTKPVTNLPQTKVTMIYTIINPSRPLAPGRELNLIGDNYTQLDEWLDSQSGHRCADSTTSSCPIRRFLILFTHSPYDSYSPYSLPLFNHQQLPSIGINLDDEGGFFQNIVLTMLAFAVLTLIVVMRH